MSIRVPEKVLLATNIIKNCRTSISRCLIENLDIKNFDSSTYPPKFVMRHIQAIGYISGCFLSLIFYSSKYPLKLHYICDASHSGYR